MIQLSIDDYVESIRSRVYTLDEILSHFPEVFRLGQHNEPGDEKFQYHINRHIIFWEYYFDNFIYRCCYHMNYTGYAEEVIELNNIIEPNTYQQNRLYGFYEMVRLFKWVYDLGISAYVNELQDEKNYFKDKYLPIYHSKIKELNLNQTLNKIEPYPFKLSPCEEYIVAWEKGH